MPPAALLPTARVALETTLLLHGVPREAAVPLYRDLVATVRQAGAEPALIGVMGGQPVVGMSEAQFVGMLGSGGGASASSGADGGVEGGVKGGAVARGAATGEAGAKVLKLNTANLGVAMHRQLDGATTVSTTMELAAGAGIRVFATGGLGGVHRNYHSLLDISTDLAALTRFPVAVVCSGVKSILDVASTREALETLGIPVVGFQTNHFPAFYLRSATPPLAVDARFDDAADLARFAARELARTRRGIVIANPIPVQHELSIGDWNGWLAQANRDAEAKGVAGREVTPFVLGRLHELSRGATLRANIELVKSNAGLAGRIASAMSRGAAGR